MRFLTVEQMRGADQAAIVECDIPEQVLMNRAGVSLARFVERMARLRDVQRIVLVAGHGNNGGDVCVAARCLHDNGFKVHVIMTCIPSAMKGAARAAWDDMQVNEISFEVAASEANWSDSDGIRPGSLLNYGIVVDGVLGTGCSGAPRGVAAAAIRWINSVRPHALVVAADLPSGMNGDSGESEGEVVKADATVTFAAPKQGFCNVSAMPLLGHLLVADIGIPDEIAFKYHAQSKCQLIAHPELLRLYHQRAWLSNKGTYGHVCVIGGVETYPNAPVLSALGALRSGAGLVTLRSCCANSGCALARIPEAIINPLSLDDFSLADNAARAQLCALDTYSVIVAGPGLGRSESAAILVRYLIENYKGLLVLDADALHLLAGIVRDGYKVRDNCALIITPHPGEAAWMLSCEVKDVQDDRIAAVRELAGKYSAIAVLKGAGTLVSDGESLPWLNLTGNPGMATAGTGDLLAGIIGGLLAQGLDRMLAATMGVWVHGTAGDLACFKGSQSSLTTSDVLEMLPAVYQNIERQ